VSRSDDQRVQDILDASDQILNVVKDGRDAWDKDRLRQLAVERLLEIIGESANSLTDSFRAQYPDIAWRDIIGLRIVLAHHYHRVDPNQVWVIAETEVERLAERLRTDRRQT
jgi:uncharacterized protein with HEPN domain